MYTYIVFLSSGDGGYDMSRAAFELDAIPTHGMHVLKLQPEKKFSCKMTSCPFL